MSQRRGQLGDMTAAHRESAALSGITGPGDQRIQSRLETRHACEHRRIESSAKPVDEAAEVILAPHDQFRCRRRCRRAQVGNEIGDGEVGFVADRRDHGNRAGGYRAGHLLFVERPQVLGRSAAASDDDDVDAVDARDEAQCPHNFAGRVFSLHA